MLRVTEGTGIVANEESITGSRISHLYDLTLHPENKGRTDKVYGKPN